MQENSSFIKNKNKKTERKIKDEIRKPIHKQTKCVITLKQFELKAEVQQEKYNSSLNLLISLGGSDVFS